MSELKYTIYDTRCDQCGKKGEDGAVFDLAAPVKDWEGKSWDLCDECVEAGYELVNTGKHGVVVEIHQYA